jgi:hypothetical protein
VIRRLSAENERLRAALADAIGLLYRDDWTPEDRDRIEARMRRLASDEEGR